MANFCTSYLAFDCFSTELGEEQFAAKVFSGDFAFYEYAACNWYKHLESRLKITQFEEIPKPIQKAFLILEERHKNQTTISSGLKPGQLCKSELSRILSEIQGFYSQTDTISADDSEQGELLVKVWAK